MRADQWFYADRERDEAVPSSTPSANGPPPWGSMTRPPALLAEFSLARGVFVALFQNLLGAPRSFSYLFAHLSASWPPSSSPRSTRSSGRFVFPGTTPEWSLPI